jgi:hypothetical protein
VLNTVEVFEYSNDPQEELFNVRFSLVGSKRKILKTPPVSVESTVYYSNKQLPTRIMPIIQLVAPTKIQVATFFGKVHPF